MAINLYEVSVGTSQWHYTSGEFDVSAGGSNYIATPIKRTDLTFELEQNELTLTVPADLEPFSTLKYAAPLVPFELVVYSYPSSAAKFKGVVTKASFDAQTNVAKILVGSSSALEGSTSPSFSFGVTCSHELFSGFCGLLSSAYELPLLKEDIIITGATMEATQFGEEGDNYYTGGYLVANNGESQYISSQVGTTITLMAGLVMLDDITNISFYPGCNKSHVTCDAKFNNQVNFGGFPFIPEYNAVTEGF